MEHYKMIVNGNVDMSGKIDEGTLDELIESTGFCFYEVEDDDRPFLVYRDVDEMERDPDGSHAIGYLTVIQEVEWMQNERRISVYTNADTAKKLKMIAIEKGTTVTALLNEAINKILDENKILRQEVKRWCYQPSGEKGKLIVWNRYWEKKQRTSSMQTWHWGFFSRKRNRGPNQDTLKGGPEYRPRSSVAWERDTTGCPGDYWMPPGNSLGRQNWGISDVH